MGKTMSALGDKDHVMETRYISFNHSNGTILKRFDKMKHKFDENYISIVPFCFMDLDGEKSLFVQIDCDRERKEYKQIVINPMSDAPLFQTQTNHASNFETLCLEDNIKQKKILFDKINKLKGKADFRVCLLVCNATEGYKKCKKIKGTVSEKDVSAAAMNFTVMFFSWIIETMKLSYSELELFTCSVSSHLAISDDYGKICSFVSDSDIDAEALIKEAKPQDEVRRPPFDIVFKLDAFSSLELYFKK